MSYARICVKCGRDDDQRVADQRVIRTGRCAACGGALGRTSPMHGVHDAARGRCGCWLSRGDAVVCECGSAYLRDEVVCFSYFWCYDCGRRLRPFAPAPAEGAFK